MEEKNEIILYQPDETVKLEVRMSEETVWLTQQQMATLFGVKENNITYHIRGIYSTCELEPESTTQKIRVVRQEGMFRPRFTRNAPPPRSTWPWRVTTTNTHRSI